MPLAIILLIMLFSINLQAQNAEESLAVFPNPMLDKATLQFNSDDNPTEIVVYNIIGKEIQRQKLIVLGQNSN